jgi:hypothetical protein
MYRRISPDEESDGIQKRIDANDSDEEDEPVPYCLPEDPE